MPGLDSRDNEKALTLFRAGNPAAAAQVCEAILRRNRRDLHALYLLALIAVRGRDCAEAERIFAKLTKIHANSAEIWNNRGSNLYAISAEIWNNRGSNLYAMNLSDRALEAFDQALAIEPTFVEALYNRGKLLDDAEQLEAALASYDKCLELQPRFVSALNNRGNVLEKLERNDEALTSYTKCIAAAPTYAAPWKNTGVVSIKLRRYEEAANALARALELDPAEDAIGHLIYARQQLCDWGDLPALISKLVDGVQKGKVAVPFVLLGATDSAELQLQCAQDYVTKKYALATRTLWRGERYAHERIRIAYLSADFRDHATAYLTAGLFERHDRTKFETIAISFSPHRPDDTRQRIRNAFEKFVDVRNMSDGEVANLLRKLEVDIAVDLMGFTQHHRLGILTLRPAPIQVNYLGYPGTVGARYIDYIIADRVVIPTADQQFYSEKIVCLPDTYQPNDDRRACPALDVTRSGQGLPEHGFVFCSFNKTFKITQMIFDIWMRLLRQVDGSVLWLLEGDALVPVNLGREAEKRGVAARRLIFAKRVAMEHHLARHRLADLFLDTLPYNAHTTASDALWMGLPVLTCPGKTFASRVAASLLSVAGLEDLIASSLEDYEARALKLARDRPLLDSLRKRVESSRHDGRLFDTALYTRQIEAAYVEMWERLQRGEPPADISVRRLERDGRAGLVST
jgi:predicted O-linked N-acetylglucosamine transferase (SPINDLY family)